jgi:PleD family two-component response regulator
VRIGVGDLLYGASSASEGLSRAGKPLYFAKEQGRNQVSGCTNVAKDFV